MTSTPRIIFVCIGNSCRSQMAQGFFNHYAKERDLDLLAENAGTRPEGYVHPNAIEVMAEKNIDISHHTSNGMTPEQTLDYDWVITMGCSDKDVCPATFNGTHEDWDIDDPIDHPLDVYRRVRDQIEGKILKLVEIIS